MWQVASRAFGLWNKARVNGQLVELAGLTARRAAEAAMYLKPEADAPSLEMPQAVEAESPMTASPINRGGIAAAGTGVIAILSEAGASLGGLREPLGAARDFMASTLGVPPSWILPLMLVGVGLAVVYWRYKQRSGGWA
jgi:lysozyme